MIAVLVFAALMGLAFTLVFACIALWLMFKYLEAK